MFLVELVWNREFHWCGYRSCPTLEEAVKAAESIRDSGDGARVKKVRVIDETTGEPVWPKWEVFHKET